MTGKRKGLFARVWEYDRPLAAFMLLPPLIMTAVGIVLPESLYSDQGTPVGPVLVIGGAAWLLMSFVVLLFIIAMKSEGGNPMRGGNGDGRSGKAGYGW